MLLSGTTDQTQGGGLRSSPRVVVATEPRAYREAIALALSMLRPDAEVVAMEPDELEREIGRRPPDVALWSHLRPAVAAAVATWVLLYPEGATMAVVSVDGQQSTTGRLALADLAAMISSRQPHHYVDNETVSANESL